jgi:hypothetical protein
MRGFRRFGPKPARRVKRLFPWLGAVAALATILLLFQPAPVKEAIEDGGGEDWFRDLLGGSGLGNAVDLSGEVKQYTFQYTSGDLTSLGSVGYAGEGDFGAESTSTTGSHARFDLVKEGKTLRTKTAPYTESLTYFLVTVPMGEADTLVVTVGAAVLEVELE